MKGRIKGCIFLIGAAALLNLCVGCQYLEFGDDNQPDTLISGHAQGESKRHASDWANPLLDGILNAANQSDCPTPQ